MVNTALKLIGMRSHELLTTWRKYGAFILAPLSIISLHLPNKISAVIALSYLTIPCGIKIINTNKILWYTRQFFFLATSLLLLCSCTRNKVNTQTKFTSKDSTDVFKNGKIADSLPNLNLDSILFYHNKQLEYYLKGQAAADNWLIKHIEADKEKANKFLDSSQFYSNKLQSLIHEK